MFLAGSVRMSLITPLFCNRHLRHASYCFQKAAKLSQNLPFVRQSGKRISFRAWLLYAPVLAIWAMWPVYILAAVLFIATVAVNVLYWRRRAGLSADERRAEDADDRRDASIW